MRHKILALFFACAALVVLAVPAFAWAPDVNGQPANFGESGPLGYYLWHTPDDGWHLRTHGPGQEHVFTATLHTDGTFEAVDPIRLEPDDRADLQDGGQTLALHFHTYDGIDGVDFAIQGGNSLQVSLSLDGQMMNTGSVYVGATAWNPSSNPFTLYR